MKKGFTIIELLVASLLLGMLVTILTMIFNQSSIAWRTGIASNSNMDRARSDIAQIREEADNAFVNSVGETHFVRGLWKADGSLRNRACDLDPDSESESNSGKLSGKLRAEMRLSMLGSLSIGSGRSAESLKNFTVNVKSAGPNKEFDDWDDIWSFPDDPSEWNK